MHMLGVSACHHDTIVVRSVRPGLIRRWNGHRPHAGRAGGV